MSKRFTDKIAIVTGAGRGMGKAIADALCAEGAKVMVAARTLSHGQETVDEFRRRGHEASLCQVDVTRRADMSKLVRETIATYGGIDIVVHSGAEIVRAPVREVADEDIEKMLCSNLKASIWLTKDAAPHLAARGGGRLIFISSICGPRTAIPGLAIYGAAKAGMNAFVEGAAVELAPDKITVNVVEPGTMQTARMLAQVDPERRKRIATTIPMRRLGEPEEIANAVLFLAAPQSGYITGRALTVDGGQSLSTTSLGSPG
jgi:3-oxoacyl-[acyl-carrier protein] reductase